MKRVLAFVKSAGGWIARQYDEADAMFVIGLVLMAIGLSQLSTAAALIVPGAILAYVAIFRAPTGSE